MIFAILAAIYLTGTGAPAAEPTHDPFRGADYFLQYGFGHDEDEDFDQQPDDWSRRRGPRFPTYVEAKIDRSRGDRDGGSLRFGLNGGPAVMYSPRHRIDPAYSYVFIGSVRTQLLRHGAAVVSVSILNYKRQRIQRLLSQPVMGTHSDWVRVKIGPVRIGPEARFVVIGCHLLQGDEVDVQGAVWFDNLRLGRLPQLELKSNYAVHFQKQQSPTRIAAVLSGLDRKSRYRLQLRLVDLDGEPRMRKEFSWTGSAVPTTSEPADDPRRHVIEWSIPPQADGAYCVKAILSREGEAILRAETEFAEFDRVASPGSGRFGWSIAKDVEGIPPARLIALASQAGISRLKYPVWRSVSSGQRDSQADHIEFFEQLAQNGIRPVALLNDPPEPLRRQFGKDWPGVGEIFRMPPKFWASSIQRVVAKYSPTVRHWQLGGEEDDSFMGMDNLAETLQTVKREIDRIGHEAQIGICWDRTTPRPDVVRNVPHLFLSVCAPGSGSSAEAPVESPSRDDSATGRGAEAPRWTVLKPLPRSKHTPVERAADLVKRMVTAKVDGADAVFAFNVFDREYGLLHGDGSPMPLFLPWRTTAVALRGAEFLGSFHLPGGSENYAFAKNDEVILVVWAENPTTETLYLGEDVTSVDVWGRQRGLPAEGNPGRQSIETGPVPRFLKGCSKSVALWRLAVRFERGRLASVTGEQRETLLGKNTFPQGVSGEVRVSAPREWQVEPQHWRLPLAAGESFEFPMSVTLPATVGMGPRNLAVDFEIVADRPYRFRVYRRYRIGRGDVKIAVAERWLDDGYLELEQTITNHTSPPEVLNLQCSLFIPGRKREKRTVTKLREGQDRKYYLIPDADELRGRQLWLRVVQVGGRRVLNYRWVVGENREARSIESGTGDGESQEMGGDVSSQPMPTNRR